MRKGELLITPPRPEFAGEIVIGQEVIDRNGHVNNAHYLPLYQEQRRLYLVVLGIDLQDIQDRLGLRTFITDFEGSFRREVKAGDHVTVHTTAETRMASVVFNQRMVRDGIEIATFNCVACVVNGEGRIQRLPDEIREKIQNASFVSQTGKTP